MHMVLAIRVHWKCADVNAQECENTLEAVFSSS